MKRHGRYFKLGVFVLVAVGLGVAALLVLGAGALFRQSFTIETYLDESVQGLAIGSPVKFRGVQIGTVQEIDFVRNVYYIDPQSEDYIKYGSYVVIKMRLPRNFIESEAGTDVSDEELLQAMINDGLRVRLTPQGLTGQAYLEVDYVEPERHPPLEISWSPDSTYIPSATSTISRLSSTVEDLVAQVDPQKVNEIATNLAQLLVLMNRSIEAANVPRLSRDVHLTLTELRETNQALQRVVNDPGFQNSPRRIDEALSSLTRSMDRMDRLMIQNSDDINQTVTNMRIVSEDLREMTENAKRYPSYVIFGQPPGESEAWSQ